MTTMGLFDAVETALASLESRVAALEGGEAPPIEVPRGAAFDVTSYGAFGDGETDDRAAILAAISAANAASGHVYFPTGTYLLSTAMTIPDGSYLQGELGVGPSSTTAHLKGKVTFGSDSTVCDLLIGNNLTSTHHTAGADSTTLRRCRFRGGGGAAEAEAPVFRLGYGKDISNLILKDCEFERNYGTEDGFTKGYNCISGDERTTGHIEYVTFDGCHIGVANEAGVTGSARMGFEITVNSGPPAGWHDIIVRDCIFEVTDAHSLDFSDNINVTSGNVIVEGCTFKGAGSGDKTDWGWGLNLEYPYNALIRNNTFGRCSMGGIYITRTYGTGQAYEITGNTFDYDTDNGVVKTGMMVIALNGYGNVVKDNVLTYHEDTCYVVLALCGCDHNTVTGNTVYCNASQDGVAEYFGTNTNNTITPNTVVKT